MNNKDRLYIGGFLTEIEAAHVYDVIAILVSGAMARTNFSYSRNDLKFLFATMRKHFDKDGFKALV